MTAAFDRYRQLAKELAIFRQAHPGSEEEDPILDEMTAEWYKLSDEEMDALNSDVSQTFLGIQQLKGESK